MLRREAVNASPRVPESSEMVGPWLSRLLLRWPVLTEELQESSPAGGISYSVHRAGSQAGTQARVQDPLSTLDRCWWSGAWLGKEEILIKSYELIDKTRPMNTLLLGLLSLSALHSPLAILWGLPPFPVRASQ